MQEQKVFIDKNKCIKCKKCEKVCVAHNIEMGNESATTLIDNCLMCGQCSAVCPTKAITLSGNLSQPKEKNGDVKLNPQEVLDVIRFRRSIRKFKQMDIAPEIIEQILEAGRLTHTAKNMQDVSFTVLHTEKDRAEQLAIKLFKKFKPLANLISPLARNSKIDEQFFFFNAPVAIVIFAKDNANGLLAAQNMEFVAEAHGLGVLYSGYFTMAAKYSRKLKKLIQVSKGKHIAMTLVLGYPDVKFLRATPHKNLDVRYL